MLEIIEIQDFTYLEELAVLFDGYRVFYKAASDVPAAKKFLSERIEKKDSVIFLIRENGKGRGFTQLYPTFSSVSMRSFYILNDLYVDSSCRGKGLGEQLLLHAQKYAEDKSQKGLALETGINNPAQKLYERLGWIEDKEYLHYFWTTKFFQDND